MWKSKPICHQLICNICLYFRFQNLTWPVFVWTRKPHFLVPLLFLTVARNSFVFFPTQNWRVAKPERIKRPSSSAQDRSFHNIEDHPYAQSERKCICCCKEVPHIWIYYTFRAFLSGSLNLFIQINGILALAWTELMPKLIEKVTFKETIKMFFPDSNAIDIIYSTGNMPCFNILSNSSYGVIW